MQWCGASTLCMWISGRFQPTTPSSLCHSGFKKVRSIHDTTRMPNAHKILIRRWFNPPCASVLCLFHVAGHVTCVPCGCVAGDVPRVDLMNNELCMFQHLYHTALPCNVIPKYILSGFAPLLGGDFERCKENTLTPPPLDNSKFPCHVLFLAKATYMALSRQRDATIFASLIRRGNLYPVNGTEVFLQLTAQRWLCPANRRKKSTGAAVVVQQWVTVCMLLLCSVNGTPFVFVEPSFY